MHLRYVLKWDLFLVDYGYGEGFIDKEPEKKFSMVLLLIFCEIYALIEWQRGRLK